MSQSSCPSLRDGSPRILFQLQVFEEGCPGPETLASWKSCIWGLGENRFVNIWFRDQALHRCSTLPPPWMLSPFPRSCPGTETSAFTVASSRRPRDLAAPSGLPARSLGHPTPLHGLTKCGPRCWCLLDCSKWRVSGLPQASELIALVLLCHHASLPPWSLKGGKLGSLIGGNSVSGRLCEPEQGGQVVQDAAQPPRVTETSGPLGPLRVPCRLYGVTLSHSSWVSVQMFLLREAFIDYL